MILKIRYNFVLFFLFGVSLMFSQKLEFNKLNFEEIKEVVSKRPISKITQDNRGFIWIGTQGNGLYRFDGIHAKNYVYNRTNQNTIDSNFIYTVFLDSKGRLWVGTKRGLNLYNCDLDRFERVPLTDTKGVDSSLDVKCMIEDKYGNLILGTYGKGVFKLSTKSMSVTKIAIGPFNEKDLIVHEFAKNKKDEIYMSTRIGLFTFNKEKDRLFRKKFLYQEEYITIDFVTRSLIVDPEDNLWIGSDENGLFKKDISGVLTAIPITKKKVLSMLYKDDTFFWGTENDGLLIMDKNGALINRYTNNYDPQKGIDSDSIWELFEDKEGRIWIGYFDKGVGVSDPLASKFQSLTTNLNSNQSLQGKSVSAIQQDNTNQLWFGVDGGIDIYNSKTGQFKHINNSPNSLFKGLTSTAILKVYIDKKNNLWVGTWDAGIFYLKNGATVFKNYSTKTPNNQLSSDAIFDFAEDSKGNIFMASFIKGIHYYNAKDNKVYYCQSKPFTDHGLINQDVRVVFADSQDNIWVGTQNDIYKIKLITNNDFEIERITHQIPDKLRNHPGGTHILSFHESKDGTIWIGTNGSGLLSYNPVKKKIEDRIEIEGFKETVVNSILEIDENLLLIAGSLGITRVDLKKKYVCSLNKDDGLLSTNFNNGALIKDSKGMVYIGSFEGVNYFNPLTIEFNPITPKTYLTSLKIFNEEITPLQANATLTKQISQTKNITLTHKQSVFTLDYSSINFTRAETTNYAYKLEGFDENWNYVGTIKNATYTNLKPGNYKFQVKASNNDGQWSEIPTILNIDILSPWWLKWWAKLSYILLFSLLLYCFIKYRTNAIKRKTQLEYEKQINEQIKLEEGRQFEKDRIAKELHDGVLGSIFGIRLGLDAIDLTMERKESETFQKYLRKLSELEVEIRAISHDLSLNQPISEIAFVEVLEEYVKEQCHLNQLNYKLNIDDNIKWSKIDKTLKFNLFRVIQELLQNVIAHANATKVDITLVKKTDRLDFIFADNGIGFKENATEIGIGIKNLKSRIKNLSGTIQFENSPENGAIIIANLPFK